MMEPLPSEANALPPVCSSCVHHPPTTTPQEEVHLLVPADSLMFNFWVTMVLAIVGQSVGLLVMIYQQIR
jgi:hypothetical protein